MSAEAADRLLPGPAVVLGSLPPEGRDLDLLVPAAQEAEVREALSADGWHSRGDEFVRFRDGGAYAVDVLVLEERAPTPAAARTLLAEAEPLPGYRWLRAPTSAHQLLLLAQRLTLGMVVDPARAARLERFTGEDWAAAAVLAPSWGLDAQLAELDRARQSPAPGPGPGVRRRRSRVVALSGLDGAGKSTQAEHLATALAALGHDVVIEWNKLGRDRSLERLAAPVKALVATAARTARRTPTSGSGAGDSPSHDPGEVDVDEAGETRNHPDGPRPPAGPGTRLRERSVVLTWCWTCVVAVTNARTHRRAAAGHPGQVVLCDRYVLDTAAHLRYRYPTARRFRLQQALNRRLSPTPRVAIFLDVEPEEARRRKPEQYTTRDLGRLRSLYLEEAVRTRVVVVDAGRPELEVAAHVAEVAWRGLATPSRLGAVRSLVRRRVRRLRRVVRRSRG